MTQETKLQIFDELKAAVTVLVSPITQIAVKDLTTDTEAAKTIKEVKAYINKIEEKRKELVAPLNAELDRINNYAREIKEPLVKAESSIKEKRTTFAREEEQRRENERKRLEAERQAELKRQEDERRKREAEEKAKRESEEKARREQQERERKELEARLQEEEAALKAFGCDPEAEKKRLEDEATELRRQQEAANRIEQERIEQQRLADQARRDREDKERAAAYQRQQRELEASRPKNIRKDWKFEILDVNVIPRIYMQPSDVALNTAIRQGIREIPGVRIYETMTAVGR